MKPETETYTRADVFKGGPGLCAYAFRAALYCPACARGLDFGPGPFDWLTFCDSESVPSPVFFGESDAAEFCDTCSGFLYGADGAEENTDGGPGAGPFDWER